jgi:hypothetical protein
MSLCSHSVTRYCVILFYIYFLCYVSQRRLPDYHLISIYAFRYRASVDYLAFCRHRSSKISRGSRPRLQFRACLQRKASFFLLRAIKQRFVLPCGRSGGIRSSKLRRTFIDAGSIMRVILLITGSDRIASRSLGS